jgi:hypothetical protein
MHGKESVEVEERYEAGELVPPYSKEEELAYLDFTRRYNEWRKKIGHKLREKGDLE